MMASLYNRATPPQQRILRAVEGAVHNAAHAHPEFKVSDRFARSVAKRAAGTISAMPGLLAGLGRSNTKDVLLRFQGQLSTASNLCMAPGASSDFSKAKPEETVSDCERRLLFFPVQIALGKLARNARKAGQQERLSAFVEALQLIDATLREQEAP